MSRKSRGSDRTSVVIWGLILIGVGSWFLLRTLGFDLPSMGQMWPIFPTLVGLGMFVGWLFTSDKRKNHGIMIPATINFLIGLFFFTFTLGIFSWDMMGVLWPVFPLIVGIAFFMAWVGSLFSNWGLLVPAGITATVGIVGLGFTLGMQSGLLGWIWRLWPLALIALGVLILIGGLLNAGRQGRDVSGESVARAPREPAPAEDPMPEAVLETYESADGETSAQAFKRQDE